MFVSYDNSYTFLYGVGPLVGWGPYGGISVSQTHLVFSSPELKAQVSYSDRPLSGVRLSVRLSVNFYIFDFFSRTTGANFNQTWHKSSLGEGDSSVFKGRG
jgi:hypothetical protein